MEIKINFRPLEPQTLRLVLGVHKVEGEDPVNTYSRLISAALVAGAMLGLTAEDVAKQTEQFYAAALRAVEGRPQIFGDKS